jgi:hypothetical protein
VIGSCETARWTRGRVVLGDAEWPRHPLLCKVRNGLAGDVTMHEVQLNTFGDVASFVFIIGGLLSITYFMIRKAILDRPGIRRIFQLTCLCAGIFALTVVIGFLQPHRPPPEWLVNAGVASMLGGLIAWASCAVAVAVSLFRKA